MAGPSSLGQHQSVVDTSAGSSNSANPILTDPTSPNCQATFRISTSDILKLSHAGRPAGGKPSRSWKTAMLTSSVYKTKNELFASQAIKEQRTKAKWSKTNTEHKEKTTEKDWKTTEKRRSRKEKVNKRNKKKVVPAKEVNESSSESEQTDATCLH